MSDVTSVLELETSVKDLRVCARARAVKHIDARCKRKVAMPAPKPASAQVKRLLSGVTCTRTRARVSFSDGCQPE